MAPMAGNPFTDHPRAAGETYLQHMGVAFGVGAKMFVGALACFIHGLLPFAFRTTGSQTIRTLHARVAGRTPETGDKA